MSFWIIETNAIIIICFYLCVAALVCVVAVVVFSASERLNIGRRVQCACGMLFFYFFEGQRLSHCSLVIAFDFVGYFWFWINGLFCCICRQWWRYYWIECRFLFSIEDQESRISNSQKLGGYMTCHMRDRNVYFRSNSIVATISICIHFHYPNTQSQKRLCVVKSWSVPISCIAHSKYSACFACVMRVQFFQIVSNTHLRDWEWSTSGTTMLKTWYHHFELSRVCSAHSAIILLRAIANSSTKWNATNFVPTVRSNETRGSLFRLRSGVRSAGSYEHVHFYRMHIQHEFLVCPQKADENSYELPMRFTWQFGAMENRFHPSHSQRTTIIYLYL